MEGFGYAVAVLLSGIFVWAAAAKLARVESTASGFRALGLPGASVLARAVPFVELGLAVALLAAPRTGGLASLVVLAAFTGVLARALATGVTAGCNCFGSGGAGGRLSWIELARNAVLLAAAAAAVSAPEPVVPSVAAIVTGLFLGGVAASVLVVALRRHG